MERLIAGPLPDGGGEEPQKTEAPASIEAAPAGTESHEHEHHDEE
jgi:hypothetical protein